MRIIGGTYKRRLIVWPDDQSIRPTKDRIREAIFSSLNNVDDFVVLDLFAGSGSYGLEAISRGARKSYFVDKNKIAIRALNESVNSLKIPNSQYEIIEKDSYNALEIFKNNHQKFDLIFIDPPYKEGKYKEIIDFINKNELLNENGVLVVEINYALDFSYLETFLNKEYKYGEIFVYILRKKI